MLNHKSQRQPRPPRRRGSSRIDLCWPATAAAFRRSIAALPSDQIDGFDGQRIQRPETALGDSQQGPASEPTKSNDRNKEQRRPEIGQGVSGFQLHRVEPGRNRQRSKPQQQTRQNQHQNPRQHSFGRLISTSMLPANESNERRFVLDASSSKSPRRGSMIGSIASFQEWFAAPVSAPRPIAIFHVERVCDADSLAIDAATGLVPIAGVVG